MVVLNYNDIGLPCKVLLTTNYSYKIVAEDI